jgi:alpha-1,6-mannosyltransferase
MRASIQRDPPTGWLGALRLAPGWVSLGTLGSVLVTIAGARLGGGNVIWWLHPKILSGGNINKGVLYAGMVAIAIAWAGLGRVASTRLLRPSQLATVAILWSVPLAVGVPLFSRDIYSYLAQGTIAHLGLNPYHDAPAVLGRLGHVHVLNAVDPFWRTATAPYGPLFLAVTSAVVGLVGSNLVVGALLVRAFDLLGLVLLAVCVPRLARRTGADPTRAFWLAVLSPLLLLQLVAAGHNDLLMVGVMVAGVTLALERRPLLGIAVCTVAATIKVPALAAVVFIAAVWIRSEPSWRMRLASLGKAAVVVLGTAAAVTLITGFGVGWLSAALFSTPARVRIAITPASDISWTFAPLLHDLGLAVSYRGLEAVLRPLAFAASAVVAVALLWKSRWQTLVQYLGLALIAFALGGPAVWPWYFSWGLVLLAAWAPAQRSRAVVFAVLLASFLVKPNGIFVLPLGLSPVVVVLWIVTAAIAVYMWRRRERVPGVLERSDGLRPARSALAEQ